MGTKRLPSVFERVERDWNMKSFLVITTINPPTEGIKKFASFKNLNVVVVGDKKTPKDWEVEGVTYLSCEEQEKFGFDLPWNHYSRKMIGYLYAIQNGADYIAETDDDNIPKDDWGFPKFNGKNYEFDTTMYDGVKGEGFVNIYKFFSLQNIWARGLPLDKINIGEFAIHQRAVGESVGVWQGLADEDPDVDAIYRLVIGKPCTFKEREPIILELGVVSPFNSQNTLFKKRLFPLMYLPVTVPQRFSDILRSYVAQPIMHKERCLLGITKATVVQKRNEHNLIDDFNDEVLCYTSSEIAYNTVKEVVDEKYGVMENLLLAYKALVEKGIVTKSELTYLTEWINLIKGE